MTISRIWVGIACLALLGGAGCKRHEIKEDFSKYPYQVTKTPYRAANVYRTSMAWADNNTVLFITWFKERGKWRKVLGEWKTDGQFRVIEEEPNSLCARDGYVLYYVGKLGGPKSKPGNVFYGRYGKDIKLYPKETVINVTDCLLHRRRTDLLKKYDQNFSELIKPDTYISARNTYSTLDSPPSAYFIDEQGSAKLMPFSASDSSAYRYYEHMGRYYVNRISTWACTGHECTNTWQWRIWSFSDKGQVEIINISEKYPWFGYPLTARNLGHMYRLYPTIQGDFLAIGGDPSWRTKKGGGIYLMREGQDPIQLIDGSIDPPAFSPNGCKIAFARDTYPLAANWKDRTDRLVIIDLCKPNKPKI